MALRDQPYLPLYVKDFLTDEKLIECSAYSTGVYIRLLCIMHKSKEYGTIELKQKDIKGKNSCANFAYKLAKQMPYEEEEIKKAIKELKDEEVVGIEGNKMFQKRMIIDNDVSQKRSKAGQRGGFATANKTLHLEYVFLLEDEYQKLIKKIGRHGVGDYIDRLNGYLGASEKNQKKYTSHYHTILNWWRRDGKVISRKDIDENNSRDFNSKYGDQTPANVKDLVGNIAEKM